MWWMHVFISQTAQVVDPAQKLLESNNPLIVGIGVAIATLMGADKVAFWLQKAKSRNGNGHSNNEIQKTIAALAEAQSDVSKTTVDVAKTLDKFSDYAQRHFETSALEMRSVREELRAIRERLRNSDGSNSSQ